MAGKTKKRKNVREAGTARLRIKKLAPAPLEFPREMTALSVAMSVESSPPSLKCEDTSPPPAKRPCHAPAGIKAVGVGVRVAICASSYHCVKCGTIPEGQVFQCAKGCIYCPKCVGGSAKCVGRDCGVDMDANAQIRNLAAEKTIASILQLACSNPNCGILSPDSVSRIAHQEVCPHKLYSIRLEPELAPCTLQPFLDGLQKNGWSLHNALIKNKGDYFKFSIRAIDKAKFILKGSQCITLFMLQHSPTVNGNRAWRAMFAGSLWNRSNGGWHQATVTMMNSTFSFPLPSTYKTGNLLRCFEWAQWIAPVDFSNGKVLNVDVCIQ